MNTLPSEPADAVPDGMPEASAHPAEVYSEAQAAKKAGVARSTIQYARKNGRLPGAKRGETGWMIPLTDLITAGFIPAEILPKAPADEVPTDMPEASAPPADRHAEELERLRRQLTEAIAEKRDAQERAAVAEARAEAARERGDEHLRRAEQAEARLDQMLANQTAMVLMMKEQQHLIARAPEHDATPDEPADHSTDVPPPSSAPTLPEEPRTDAPEPETGTLGRRVRRWFGG